MDFKNLFKQESQKEQKIEGLSEVSIREEEKKFWKKYAEFMVSKYRDLYLNLYYCKSEFKIIKEFIQPKRGERWLDLGCGALPVSELILQVSNGELEIYAGDIHLFPAKKKLKELDNPSQIKLKYVDLTEKLPFSDNFFDGIVASKTLIYIPESQGQKGKEGLRKIFQELFRILKPGGVLIWSIQMKGLSFLRGVLFGLGYVLNPYQWIKKKCFLPLFAIKVIKLFKPLLEKGEKGIYPLLSQREYEELLISIGFKNPRWKITPEKQMLVNKVNKPL